MISSLATAAVVVLVALPLLAARPGAPAGYAAERMTVQTVRTDEDAQVAPVVMETDNGGYHHLAGGRGVAGPRVFQHGRRGAGEGAAAAVSER